jgi:NADH-quinone oxidoreductase subunit N
MPLHELTAILPEAILTLTAVLLMLTGAFFGNRAASWCSTLTLAGLSAATAALIYDRRFPGLFFGDMFSADPFSGYFRLLFFVIAALAALASADYIRRERLPAGEYYALLLFATVGMGLMAAGNELILIFIGLEISSLSSYVMVGLRRDQPSSEASLKYFLLGSFATAFLLYGIALLFGVSGSTRLTDIRAVLHGGETPITAGVQQGARAVESVAHGILQPVQMSWQEAGFPTALLALAIALIFVGLAFKISAAPFQAWTPDVYQGAPAPVAAFLSTGPKAAAFAAFLRIFQYSLASSAEQWSTLLWISAALTMVIGNFAALWQTNLKRLLAYSSIAHAGYMLVAFTAHSEDGLAAVLFYLAAYAFMNIGAFVVVSHLSGQGERYLELDDYAGLGYRAPTLAACLSIFLLSLIGIPLTAGFLGKFYVFRAAVRADLIWLTVLGVLNSAIAAYYYLRILVAMYMQPAQREIPLAKPGIATSGVLAVCALATLLLGILPHPLLRMVLRASRWLPQG